MEPGGGETFPQQYHLQSIEKTHRKKLEFLYVSLKSIIQRNKIRNITPWIYAISATLFFDEMIFIMMTQYRELLSLTHYEIQPAQ